MDEFFCEKARERLLDLEEEEEDEAEEAFWDKLLSNGEFEVELLVEALLENNDFILQLDCWLLELEPISFFDTFHFSSITNTPISEL